MVSRVVWISLLALVACARGTVESQTPEGQPAASESGAAGEAIAISPQRMHAALDHFASDALRGRFTRAESDIGAAADYIADVYRKVSLPPVGERYRVPFDLEVGSQPGPDLHMWIEDQDEVLEVPASEYLSLANGGGRPVYGTPVFVGGEVPSGIADKIVVATLDEAPATELVAARVAELEAAGASAVVLVAPSRPTTPDRLDASIPVVLGERDGAELALPLKDARPGVAMEGVSLSLAAEPVPLYEPAFNVLSWIEGSEHPEEIVILGAHLDHIGTSDLGSHCAEQPGANGPDGICNGADDNASGSAMVLEIARSIAESGFRPKRSLVFAHFAGEELGLLGSEALADHPPDAAPFSAGHVVAMINLDMVGRYRAAEGLQVGGVSSSDEWRPLLDDAGDQGLTILLERSVTGRSDHASFYRKKIPVLFFFTGLHDDYHRAGDHIDKINDDGMAAIAKIVMHITTAVAAGAPIHWTDPRSAAEGEVGRLPGTDPTTIDG